MEVRARRWGFRSSACAVRAGYKHAGILRWRAGRAHLFATVAAPCARGRASTQRCPPAARRAHRSPSSRLHAHALGTARAYWRLARPMTVAAAAARSAAVCYKRVRHATRVRGLKSTYSPDSKGWSPHWRWILNHVAHAHIQETINAANESSCQGLSIAV